MAEFWAEGRLQSGAAITEGVAAGAKSAGAGRLLVLAGEDANVAGGLVDEPDHVIGVIGDVEVAAVCRVRFCEHLR